MTRTVCIVLAAGKGTRMRSDLPKVLHAVAGRPMVLHAIDGARSLSPDRIGVVVGAGGEAVAAVLARAAPDVSIHTQAEQLGTAHAVLAARALLTDVDAVTGGDVVILYGDTPLIRPETLAGLVAARRDSGAAVAVLGFRPADPGAYGRLKLDEQGRLAAIVEFKEASAEERAIGLCNSGVMCLDAAHALSILDRIGNANAKGEYYLTDAVAIARAHGLDAVVMEAASADEVLGVNARAELAMAEAAFQARLRLAAMENGATLVAPDTVFLSADTVIGRDVLIEPHVIIGPGVRIGDGVIIRGFSHIEGARIADGATIGPFARLRPGAVLAEGAHIGNFVEIKQAEIGPGAKVNHLSYVGDATIGARSNIGAGTITCNYDGFGKWRTVIGSDAFIGSDSCLVAPVTIGDGAYIATGSVITDDVAADALAIARGRQVAKPGRAAELRARFKTRAGKDGTDKNGVGRD